MNTIKKLLLMPMPFAEESKKYAGWPELALVYGTVGVQVVFLIWFFTQ